VLPYEEHRDVPRRAGLSDLEEQQLRSQLA